MALCPPHPLVWADIPNQLNMLGVKYTNVVAYGCLVCAILHAVSILLMKGYTVCAEAQQAISTYMYMCSNQSRNQ